MLWREIQHGCSCKPKIFVESKTSADCRAFEKEEKAFGKEKVSEEADMGQRNLSGAGICRTVLHIDAGAETARPRILLQVSKQNT